MLDCGFAECMFVQRLIPVFCLSKLKVSLKLGGGGGGEGGRCLAGCHVVARTLAYHPVCIWGSLVKFQGSGVVLMFDFFLRFTDISLPDVFRGPGASVHMLSLSPVSLTPDPSLSCTYSVLYVF